MNNISMNNEQCATNDRGVRWASILGAGMILLAIYAATLSPTITWAHYGADGGDLVTAVARGSIPHPPGFPTYLLLGKLFIRLPWGDPAWRLNLMSAVTAVGAACLTAASTKHLPSFAIRHSPFAICLCLGLAPLFWSQAIITEVYAPAALFVALVIYLALGDGPAWAMGLAWGIGMGVHPTLLFLAPLVLWAAWKKPGFCRSAYIKTGFLVFSSWGIMYGLVILAWSNTPSPWGNTRTLANWWTLVSGRMYHGYLFGLPLADWPRRLLAWVGLLARQFTPLGAILAGLGWTNLWRRRRSLALASALVFGAFSLYAIGYDTADSLVYLTLALPVAALWLADGLSQAAAWLSHRARWGAGAIVLLPLLQVLLFWGQLDLATDRTALEWAERTLRRAPPQAIILTNQDRHTFTLWYVQTVLGQRTDVTVIDIDLWEQASYREMMGTELGIEAVENNLLPKDMARWTGRPIVKTSTETTDDL